MIRSNVLPLQTQLMSDIESVATSQQQISTTTDINSLPPELISHIQSFLPSYRFRSSHAVGNIARRWHQAQNCHDAATLDKSIEGILGSCKTPEDVEFILKDNAFFKKFNFEQQLQIISAHPDIAMTVLNTAMDSLNSPHILTLGSQSVTVAEHILASPDLRNKLDNADWSRLVAAHKSIAQRTLNNPDNLDIFALGSIGASDLSLAERILNTPVLREKLTNNALSMLSVHKTTAERILNEEDLRNQLGALDLGFVGKTHLCIAQRVLNTPELREKLDARSLGLLGAAHQTIALRILNEPDLRSKLNGEALGELGKHLCVATRILAEPSLLNLMKLFPLSLGTMGSAHLSLAENLLKTPELCQSLNDSALCLLAMSNEGIAHRLLNEPTLRTKLTASHLSAIAGVHLSFAQRLLDEPDLLAQINSLFSLCQSHPSIVLQVLNQPDLHNKLDNGHWPILSYQYFATAKAVVENADLMAKLNDREKLLASSVINTNIMIEQAYQLHAKTNDKKISACP